MVSVSMRAAMALAVASVSTAAFGQVLQIGAAGQYGTPYATVGIGSPSWEMYRKQGSWVAGAPTVVGSNVAGNGTQFQLTGQAGGDPGWATGQSFFGYTNAASPSSSLLYLKSQITVPAPTGQGYDVNGHSPFDVRVGFVQNATAYITARGGDNADQDFFGGNRGTNSVWMHLRPANVATVDLPDKPWVAGFSNGFYAAGATSDAEHLLSPIAPTWQTINSGTPSPTDAGVAYSSAMEVSTKMTADSVIAGNVVLQIKLGNTLFIHSFNPSDAVFGAGGFDWANSKPVVFTGKANWDPNNAGVTQTLGIMSAGDANVDGNVDLSDLTILANNFAGMDKTFSSGDFSQDGLVDLTDLTILAGQWNSTVNGSFEQALQSFPELTAVPEPASLGFLTLGTLALLRRRRA